LKSIVLAGAAGLSAAAADFSFRGTLLNDDERSHFTFTMAQEGRVTVRSLSYGGGTNAEGTAVSAGGFDPSVSIFDQSGLLVASNQDGGCENVASDPSSQACWDAFLDTSLPAGTYQVVLTQSDNLARGPFLENGFAYDGAGNFTGALGFIDMLNNQRRNAYAMDIRGVNSAKAGQPAESSALVNGASNASGSIAPNTILTFYGSIPGGAQPEVWIAGKRATVLYADGNQINIVVPGDVPAGSGQPFRIQRGETTLIALTVNIVASTPALFTSNQTGSGQASLLNQDYGVNTASTPATRGTYIMVYGTGFGEANAPDGTGLSTLKAGVTATIGGVPAEVVFAGLAYGYTPGLQQINIKVPEDAPAGDAVPLLLQVNGVPTQRGTTIAVR